MTIPSYRIREELARDGQYVLHRGEIDGEAPVLVKTPVSPSPSAAAVAALRREHDLLLALDIGGAPRVRAFDPQRPALLVEDIGATPLATLLAAGRLPLSEFFPLALELVAAVAELHRRRIVHRGLSPHGILVNPQAKRAQVFDLGLASRLPQETQPAGPPHLLPGRLAYISPEQTGRMNRVVDHRADLYSLGVTFYEMLTGQPPFASEDPLELVHAHIARAPRPPRQVDPAIPEAVSDVVMKLLSKTAEARYQSAWGLEADLEECARQWTAAHAVRSFPLGEGDFSDRFTIPQRLYGREGEIRILLEAFERACAGRATLMLVAGYSGIGKTSLVHEVHKPIVERKGRFVSGKYDQLERSTPYGALLQAFRGLVGQLLPESEERIATWRERLAGALSGNGGVVSAVIPELDLLLGPQPAPPPLPPAESQNRFNYALENFLGALARPEHPLVVFLDDLQWADAASLQFLGRLLTSRGVGSLFLIGAYRDNEVVPDHPLMKALGEMRETGAAVEEVVLPNLGRHDVRLLVRDTVKGDPRVADALADLVHRKTGGNPFFATQFLKSLHGEGLLEPDRAARGWRFDLARIEQADITDNVVDLMARKLRTLARPTQEAITLAACVGSRFSLPVLAVIRQKSLREVASELWPAIEEGLVLPTSEGYELFAAAPEEVLEGAAPSYRFLHDRVQQAAYASIPEDQRKPVHLRVGRLLLAGCGGEPPPDRIFEVVNHLNFGHELIEAPDERTRLARLDLEAGRRAKDAAAFPAALDYFERGLLLLPEDRWIAHYDLALALTMEVAECRYLCGRFDEAERCFETLLREARSPLEKAEAYRMRVVQHESLARYPEGVRVAREGLALLGVTLPEDEADKRRAIEEELARIGDVLGTRPIGSLAGLPAMADPETRMIVRLLTAMWASTYILGDGTLASLLSAQMVRLSVEHGSTEESAYGYVTHAITVGPVRGDYASAYEWGELALRVNDRFDDRKRRAKIQQQFQAHVNLWRRPLETCIPYAREACRSGLETGDFTYAGYGAFTETWAALLASRDLDRFVRDYTPTVALLQRIKLASLADAQELILSWARALQGHTPDGLSLSHGSFDERAYATLYATNPFCMTFLYAARLHLGVLFEDPARALQAARDAKQQAWTPRGTIWPVMLDFWGALAMASLHESATEEERRTYRADIEGARDSLRALAESCPESFRGPWLLLAAEAERIRGRPAEGLELYNEAAHHSRQVRDLQHEAIAHERCARLWLARGREATAALYMGEAHRCYRAWGAQAKARDLETRYDRLLAARLPAEGPAPTGTASLDLSTVLKASHALTAKIDLEELLRELMKIALENAGAERGVFLQESQERLLVEAEATVDPESVQVRQSVPLEEAGGLPASVVRYVRRTGQGIVLGHAASDERFARDPYIARTGSKSILCTPVVHQGKPGGILYLENNLTTDAFTSERIEMMQILSAEAAIALENARLYEGMREEVERRSLAEGALREALSELEQAKSRLEAENVYLQEEIRTQHNFEEIVGNSPALVATLRQVEKVAPTDSTVLIYGETGTGKELFARAIHARSPRRDRPLVKVNCGAISPGLVESELFGHVKGAFTGALQARTGRFELAHGGTLFLDEVSELPLDTQVKLLRVLQERELEPVGSGRTVRVDVRVIAASNRKLDEAVRAGSFRADLLYRLNVFPIEVPPLRERASDLPLLVSFFVGRLATTLGKHLEGVTRGTMDVLMAYSWPGNVRELQNVMERAAILAQGPLIEIDSLSATPPGGAGERTIEALEREHIASVLRTTRGVIEGPRGAASVLGLHPNTLRSRMKKLGVERLPRDTA